MDRDHRMNLLKLIVAVAVASIGAAALVVWGGVFNVAATDPHDPVTLWFLSMVRDRSIAVRAVEDLHPPSLTDSRLIAAGFRSYHTMCLTCHGAPGQDPSPVNRGLNPTPPKLSLERVQRRSDAQLFWVVKHGIRMTGMPGFGPTHSDDKLWAIVAFLRHLPKLSPQEYGEMVKASGLPEGMPDADADGPPVSRKG